MQGELNPKIVHVERWLSLLDPTPLECDGMTRCISTVLTKAEIAHKVHIGRVEIIGVGVIYPHFWIRFKYGLIDLRARTWLGDHDMVPHGIFEPGEGVTYASARVQSADSFKLSPVLFELLCGQPLVSFR